ncbi:hypothetical protein N9F40_01735, partial [bacterium]|nr:hypothetical protein [bacterium]
HRNAALFGRRFSRELYRRLPLACGNHVNEESMRQIRFPPTDPKLLVFHFAPHLLFPFKYWFWNPFATKILVPLFEIQNLSLSCR